MKPLFLILTLYGTAFAQTDDLTIDPQDWPFWRGPNLNAIVGDQKLPTEWSETKNVVWKTPVPGRGHSSPIIVGSRIFLATADEKAKTQSVLCFDRESGKQLWDKIVHEGAVTGRYHGKNTLASSTLASDGKLVFAVFHHEGSIVATALDIEGKQVWQEKLGKFVSHWGYSASPALHRSMVIVATDHKEGGGLFALDRATGKLRWETPRPSAPSYASPIILNVAGKDQVLICGANQVNSYDPVSGKQNWMVKGTSVECVSTIISDGDRIFATGGFPAKETLCIKADGSGEVLWRVKAGDFVPSQLIHKGFIYTVLDNGVAFCLKADTGEEVWRDRLGSSAFSASPILVGDNIFVPSETGRTHVFKANPKKLEVVADNRLGKAIYATAAVSRGRLYLRVVTDGKQEMLYCIGN